MSLSPVVSAVADVLDGPDLIVELGDQAIWEVDVAGQRRRIHFMATSEMMQA